jgi:5-methylcytosine-specific restriction protein A
MQTESVDRPSSNDRGYDSRWRKAAQHFLNKYPFCEMCSMAGTKRLAVHVDHVIPHKGDMNVFWDSTNWQGLCMEHHNRFKQQIENRGYSSEVGLDGFPLDENHPANRKR